MERQARRRRRRHEPRPARGPGGAVSRDRSALAPRAAPWAAGVPDSPGAVSGRGGAAGWTGSSGRELPSDAVRGRAPRAPTGRAAAAGRVQGEPSRAGLEAAGRAGGARRAAGAGEAAAGRPAPRKCQRSWGQRLKGDAGFPRGRRRCGSALGLGQVSGCGARYPARRWKPGHGRVCVWGVRGAVIRDSGPSASLTQRLRRLPGTDLRVFPFGGITTPSP